MLNSMQGLGFGTLRLLNEEGIWGNIQTQSALERRMAGTEVWSGNLARDSDKPDYFRLNSILNDCLLSFRQPMRLKHDFLLLFSPVPTFGLSHLQKAKYTDITFRIPRYLQHRISDHNTNSR